jgi:hypothetical protein
MYYDQPVPLRICTVSFADVRGNRHAAMKGSRGADRESANGSIGSYGLPHYLR